MNIKMAFLSPISFVNLKVNLCSTGLPKDSYPGTWLGSPIVEHTLQDIYWLELSIYFPFNIEHKIL